MLLGKKRKRQSSREDGIRVGRGSLFPWVTKVCREDTEDLQGTEAGAGNC